MMRGHTKFIASLKGEVCPGRRASVEYGGRENPWPSSHTADSEGLELVFGEESGFVMMTGVTASSDSPVLGSIAAESPAG